MSVNHFDDESVAAGTIVRKWVHFDQDYFGFGLRFPCIHIRGAREGVNGIVLAGIHGDELNGIQIIHFLSNNLDATKLKGQLILLPVANPPGFFLQSRYMPDRRDLNRMFPGDAKGSEGSRLANFIWRSFIEGADFGVDLHSASYNRWNFPHIRGNMRTERVRVLSQTFGAPVVIHSQGVQGSLRREATKRGIPFILLESGQSNRFERKVVQIGISGIWNILKSLEMIDYWDENIPSQKASTTYYRKTTWVRSEVGGLFIPTAQPGDTIHKGDPLGVVQSALGEVVAQVRAHRKGVILGFNLHPQVVPGRALYHIAYDEASLAE